MELVYYHEMGFHDGSAVKKPLVMRETQETCLVPGSGRSPEEEMATHSSILAWKIPWSEEPGGLESMSLQSRTRLSK